MQWKIILLALTAAVPWVSWAQECPSSKCLFAEKNKVTINVDCETMALADEYANTIDASTRTLADTFRKFTPVKDATFPFFAVFAQPTEVRENYESSARTEILRYVLDEIFNVPPNTEAIYEAPPIPSCKTADERLSNDSPCGFCSFKNAYKYYQIQGSCLSRDLPGAGLAGREMTRIGEPLCGLDDQSSQCLLPSSRKVSLTIAEIMKERPQPPKGAPVPNLMSLYWYQIVVHETDLGQVVGPSVGGNSTSSCSANRRDLPNLIRNPYTKGIEVDCDDPFYSKYDVRCLNFQRNARLNEKCDLKIHNFYNAATAPLDLSTVYQIYDPALGAFITEMAPDGTLLKDPNGNVIIPFRNNNQHSVLAGLAVLIALMHDLLVAEIKRLKPDISVIEAFQEAQHINIAFYQHIWYFEVLELFIGTNNSIVRSLEDTYDPQVVPQILMEWATTAGRFPHVLVTDHITLADCQTYQPLETILTRDTYGDFILLAYSNFSTLTCGTVQQQWKTDGLSPEVQDRLFFDHHLDYGADLFAIDQERERDGCIEPYVNYLQRLFGVCIRDWPDLEQFMSPFAVQKLRGLYKKLEDVELYIAGDVETKVGDSLMGPTFTRITELQYENLKAGDPKFYTHALSPEQLAEVAKMTLTKYICIAAQLQFNLRDARFGYLAGSNEPVECECKTLADCFDLSVFLSK